MDNLTTFIRVYKRHSLVNVDPIAVRPDNYDIRLMNALKRGNIRLNDSAIRHTCRELKIEHSIKGIKRYLSC